MTSHLSRMGFTAFFAEQMAELPDELRPARIVGQHRREWDVALEEGTTRAVLAGKRWDPEKGAEAADAQPTVGDWVAVRVLDDSTPPVIEHILTRRTWLSRSSIAKRGTRQTLVANIDHVAVVAAYARSSSHDAVAKRSMHPRRIERYLTAIRRGGAEALVILNKSDLSPDPEKEQSLLKTRLNGCIVLSVNCEVPGGLDPLLREVESGQTVGFVGLSGVGKSSIVNRLLGRHAQKIGAEREQDSRGRHTTTHRELFPTDSGLLLIDTPGMREFGLANSTEADLGAFTDIALLAQGCRFRDCGHRKEPGCQVAMAVKVGRLQKDRLQSYLSLAEELSLAKKTEKSEPRRRGRSSKKRAADSKRPLSDFEHD